MFNEYTKYNAVKYNDYELTFSFSCLQIPLKKHVMRRIKRFCLRCLRESAFAASPDEFWEHKACRYRAQQPSLRGYTVTQSTDSKLLQGHSGLGTRSNHSFLISVMDIPDDHRDSPMEAALMFPFKPTLVQRRHCKAGILSPTAQGRRPTCTPEKCHCFTRYRYCVAIRYYRL